MRSPDSFAIFDTALPSGLRLVIEPLTHVRSVTAGVWVSAGSRFEPDHLLGVSHFLEHLVFKGTARRSVKSIARTIDVLGGQLDAFTCREQSCYFAKVLDEHLFDALELIFDILTDPLLDPEDIERERRVVLEEIKLVEDTPSDGIYDLFYSALFEGHPLGRPILGLPETVENLRRDDLVSWLASQVFPANLVIALSGSCRPNEVLEVVEKAFSTAPCLGEVSREATPFESGGRRLKVKVKESEQVHLCLGFPSVCDSSSQRYTALILNNLIGGGAASRLFQRIREEEGLAYSIHSFLDTYSDSGALGIYAGVSPSVLQNVLDLIESELQSFSKHGTDSEELSMAKDQLKGEITLALEDTASRMSRLAKHTIAFGRHRTLEESFVQIDSVSIDDVQRLAEETFSSQDKSLAVIGPVEPETLKSYWTGG